jgi:hypothetical protein
MISRLPRFAFFLLPALLLFLLWALWLKPVAKKQQLLEKQQSSTLQKTKKEATKNDWLKPLFAQIPPETLLQQPWLQRRTINPTTDWPVLLQTLSQNLQLDNVDYTINEMPARTASDASFSVLQTEVKIRGNALVDYEALALLEAIQEALPDAAILKDISLERGEPATDDALKQLTKGTFKPFVKFSATFMVQTVVVNTLDNTVILDGGAPPTP